MPSHSEEQPGTKRENSGHDSLMTADDRERLASLDDDSIVFDEDSPELPPGWGNNGVYRVGERLATPDEIEEFKRRVLAYANRPKSAQ
jgi:hypothetical protein